jgi:hypothetical protein
MSKLNKLSVKQEVIHKLAIGETQTSIAGQVGVDQSTVSRFANEDEAMKAIEVEKLKLAEVVPDAVQNVKDLVEEMKGIPKDDIQRRELSYKATKDVLKATNVYPSPQYANNIYNDNRKQALITPAFQKFIDFQARQPLDQNGDIIDVDGVNQMP